MKSYLFWLAKFITTLIVMLIFIPVLLLVISKAGEQQAGSIKTNQNKVAVVELTGPILDSKEVVKQLHKQANNQKVDGIILRINSPGGAVAPSQDIYSTIKQLKQKKPIIVSMGSVAASGGLYSALSASKIFVQPGTQTGSIGVIVQLPNFHKVTEKVGIDFLTVTSGKFKDIGNPTRALTEKDKKFLQETVNKIYQQFLNDVAEGRNLDLEQVRKFADGRLILGNEAVELGLADQVGDLYAASRAVYEVLNKPLNANQYPELVYTVDKFKKLKQFFDAIFQLPLMLTNQEVYTVPKARFMLY